MERERYDLTVQAEDQASAGRGAVALADGLREVEGVFEANRKKANDTTMDLGAIVTVIASSAATLAIAQGIAAWLRARRNVKLKIESKGGSGSIKAAVEGLDPEAALRIVEVIRKA
jgi:hypothetical protein